MHMHQFDAYNPSQKHSRKQRRMSVLGRKVRDRARIGDISMDKRKHNGVKHKMYEREGKPTTPESRM